MFKWQVDKEFIWSPANSVEKSVLAKGMNFAIMLNLPSCSEYIAAVESAIKQTKMRKQNYGTRFLQLLKT